MYRIIGGDQKEYGPVSADEIRRWVAERRLYPGSLVRAEGTSDWKPLSQWPEFAAPAPFPTAPTVQSTNNMATLGLVLSCVGLVCCGCFPFSVLGIIFSAIGLSQAKSDPAPSGRGVATAGLVIGIIALLEALIGFVLGLFSSVFESLLR